MTPAEYKSLPANLQRDVRVALACGYGWERIANRSGIICVYNAASRGDGPRPFPDGPVLREIEWLWQRWQPTTDTTIWTALMLRRSNGYRMGLNPETLSASGWVADYKLTFAFSAPTQGDAVCACFVAADPMGHLGRAGV